MTKWIIAFFVVLAIYAGAWSFVWWGPPKLRLVKKHEAAFSFANDVHTLITRHSGQLPGDWDELERWQIQENGIIKWSKKGTSDRLLLLSSPYEIIDGAPQYIRVVDPDLKAMENYINLRIGAACEGFELRRLLLNSPEQFSS